MATYSEKKALFHAHAARQQANAHEIFLARNRIKELQDEIAANNPILAGNRKVVSEKMEAIRAEQITNIQSLNFFNQLLQDLLTEKQILWQEFKTKF